MDIDAVYTFVTDVAYIFLPYVEFNNFGIVIGMAFLSSSEYYEMMLCMAVTDRNIYQAREFCRERFIDGRP